MNRLIAGLFVIVGFGVVSGVQAQEKKLERKDLPPAVEKTVARESEGAEIKGFAREKENGIQTYEVELIVNGLSKDISMDAKGNILEIEQEVPTDALPENVRDGIKKQAGVWTIGKVESITKNGTIISYETVISNGKRHQEIRVGPHGEKMKKEE